MRHKGESNDVPAENRTEAWYFAQELRGLGTCRPAVSTPSTVTNAKAFVSGSASSPPAAEGARSEAWYFAQALRGKSGDGRPAYMTEAEWQAEHEQWLRDISTLHEQAWDPSKHPRGGNTKNTGQFSEVPGSSTKKTTIDTQPKAASGTASSKSTMAPPVDPKDPSRWYLPSDSRGSWSGDKGNSKFRLKTPVDVGGQLVHEIDYKQGVPVLDKHALPGKTVAIVLTGDSRTDIANAKVAWQELNPGKELPPRAVFHHDLLHVAEETIEIDGKKTKVLVGKMQLVPQKINELVFHEGSASVAAKSYKGLGIEVDSVKRLAREEARITGKTGSLIGRIASKIVPETITKGVLPFVGRNVLRALPIGVTGLAILEFSENVKAHGIDGAIARATPVLGDLISAHDLGGDLARQITDHANAAADAALQARNTQVSEAWDEANDQTIAAFNDLASQIEVTNETYEGNRLVDPVAIEDALKIYRGRMQQANLLKATKAHGFDFDAAAKKVKNELKERLINASQKNAPRKRSGPMA
jgi:hypothetical protein